MGKDGLPYCEKDYQAKFGVRCAHCERYITGKVLQAGDNHHFHPTCARCTKCGDPFGDGEEMYMQGGAIWHPRCGPGPDARIEDVYLDSYDSQVIKSIQSILSLSLTNGSAFLLLPLPNTHHDTLSPSPLIP